MNKGYALVNKGIFSPMNKESAEFIKECEGENVEIRLYKKRSLSQNSLFHEWCGIASEHFKIKGSGKENKLEAMKDVFKHMFLGYEDKIISDKLTITGQLKQTRKLEKTDMFEFMIKIDVWCMDKELFLPHPEDSHYTKMKEANM